MPAIVFATGCFILLRNHVNLFEQAFWLVLLANVLFSLPFILRILSPSLEQALSQHDRLSLQLGITGLKKFIFLTFPSITRELQLVLGISFAFSLGDLSVILYLVIKNLRHYLIISINSLVDMELVKQIFWVYLF